MQDTFSLKIDCDCKTNIYIGRGCVKQGFWISKVAFLSNSFVIVTDDNVLNLYGFSLKNQLEAYGKKVCLISFPSGEKNKSRLQKEAIEDRMLNSGIGRDCVLLALGGGVVTDLAGFVASTFCRGIPLIFIPTTLMGMVDASIGGKVGVNAPLVKNGIGAYYFPHSIFIDLDLLATLSLNELRNGIAEVIKYALISSSQLFNELKHFSGRYDNFDPLFLNHLIYVGVKIKMDVVEKDPFEKGFRRILNFGHTIGHAIESASQFTICHGVSIAIGMIAEAFLSLKLGYLSEVEFFEIQELFKKYNFQLSKTFNMDTLKKSLTLDKKALNSATRFVILERIGKVVPFEENYCSSIDTTAFENLFLWLEGDVHSYA